MKWQDSDYLIGGVWIRLRTPFSIFDDEAYSLYRIDKAAQEELEVSEEPLICEFVPDEKMPDCCKSERIYFGEFHSVYKQEDGFLHIYSIPTSVDSSLFVWNRAVDWTEDRQCQYHYHPSMESYMSLSRLCFNAISVENLFRAENRFIFHCCYVAVKGGAILFTAPSGGGKSTQGSLWEKYGEGTIINGDRALLEYRGKAVWPMDFQ